MNAYSCDENLKSYAFECEYQDHFNRINDDFKTYHTTALNLKGHFLPLAIGYKDYYAKKNEYLNHANENLASNPQWLIWKKSQEYSSKLNPASLDINDVTKLQFHLLSTNSVGDIFNSKLGRLRTSNAEIHPAVIYTCEESKINSDVITLFRNYDLKSEEGYPLLAIKNIFDCQASNENKSGTIIFYKNAAMKKELSRWLVDFNDTLSRFELNEAINVSPYLYLADMRRWFMAISPFQEGNQSVVETLILYATTRLNLPPLVQIHREAILLTAEENRSQVMKGMKDSMVFFESCLYETKTNLISSECSPL